MKTSRQDLKSLFSSGLTQMSGDKKAYYMSATTDDLIEALRQNEKAEALKSLIKRKKEENKKSKNKKWVYEPLKAN